MGSLHLVVKTLLACIVGLALLRSHRQQHQALTLVSVTQALACRPTPFNFFGSRVFFLVLGFFFVSKVFFISLGNTVLSNGTNFAGTKAIGTNLSILKEN